jgi:proteasome lid subunit RPN8/RPN11
VKDGDACAASLRIGIDVLVAIAAHARAAAPLECCGFLVGTRDGVDESVATRNVDPCPTRFQVDPAEHIRLNRRLRGSGREIVGVYHSHPLGPATPSATDVAEAMYPEFVHVIVSLAEAPEDGIRAYRINNGEVATVALEAKAVC